MEAERKRASSSRQCAECLRSSLADVPPIPLQRRNLASRLKLALFLLVRLSSIVGGSVINYAASRLLLPERDVAGNGI